MIEVRLKIARTVKWHKFWWQERAGKTYVFTSSLDESSTCWCWQLGKELEVLVQQITSYMGWNKSLLVVYLFPISKMRILLLQNFCQVCSWDVLHRVRAVFTDEFLFCLWH